MAFFEDGEGDIKKIVDLRGISGKKKAAILMVTLGNEVAGALMKHLGPKEIETIVQEIATLEHFTNDIKFQVLTEFNSLLKAQEFINAGGVDFARSLLDNALGSIRAAEIINRIVYARRGPFDILKKTDAVQIQNFIQKEMPQTIALVLSCLEPSKSADVISLLPSDKQAEVARRIATMKQISPEMVKDIERVLEKKLSALSKDNVLVSGGVDTAVEILNVAERSVERNILESIEETDPELAEEIKKKMFVFEDIVLLDDRSIQRVLSDVDNAELAKAFKGTSERVQEKVFNNMSKRASEMIREEIEFMGPVRLKEVEEVQQKIVGVIRKLEEQGEIIISRGDQEAFV